MHPAQVFYHLAKKVESNYRSEDSKLYRTPPAAPHAVSYRITTKKGRDLKSEIFVYRNM